MKREPATSPTPVTDLSETEGLSPTAAQKRLFFSYKREDWNRIRPVKEALEAAGQEVWYDIEGIPPGSEWPERVGVAIERSRAFVAFVSRRFLESHNCRRELEEAERFDKRVVPVVLEELDPASLPESIRDSNWIQESDPASTAEKIQQAVETDVEWLDEHARLLSAALRMEREGGRSHLLRGLDLRQSARLIGRMEDRTTPPRVTPRLRLLIRRSKQNRMRMLGATAAGLAALVIFVILFLVAERARTVGESLRIASEAELRLDDQLDLAARLALISSSIDVNVSTESALLLSLTSGPGLRGSEDLGFEVDVADLSAEGRIALVADDNGMLHSVDTTANSATPLDIPGVTAIDVIDGSLALVATHDGRIVWLDTRSNTTETICDLTGQVTVVAGNATRAVAGTRVDGEPQVVVVERDSCRIAEMGTASGSIQAAGMDARGGWAVAGPGGLMYSLGGNAGELARDLTGWSAITIEGDTLWLGGEDGVVYSFDPATDTTPVRFVQAADAAVSRILLTETSMVTTGIDGFLRVWDRDDGLIVHEMTNLLEDRESAPVLGLAVSGEQASTINIRGRLQRWSLNHDSPLVDVVVPDQRIADLELVDDQPVFVTRGEVADMSGPVGSWPSAAGVATSVTFDSAGRLFAGTSEGHILELRSGEWIEASRLNQAVEGIAALGGARVAITTRDALHVLDVPTGDIERTVEGSFMSVSAVGDDLLVAGMDDGGAVLIEDDEEPHRIAFEEHRGTLDAVTSNLSRRWIITGGDDRVIRVWDMETLDLVTSLVGHNERVLDVTLNQTASKLVSVDEAGLMLVWDMVEFSQIGSPFRQPASGLAHSAEFSAASPETLYVAGSGLLTWRIGHEQLVKSACELAGNRQLTMAESQQYLDGRDSGDVCSDTDGS